MCLCPQMLKHMYKYFDRTQIQLLSAILNYYYQPTKTFRAKYRRNIYPYMVKELRTNNKKAIDLLDSKHTKRFVINFGFGRIGMTSLVVLLIKTKPCKKNGKSVVIPTLISTVQSMAVISETIKFEHTYIIVYYRTLIRFTTQFLTSLILCALIFIHECLDLQFKVNSERQIFEILLKAILFTLRVFARNLLKGSSYTCLSKDKHGNTTIVSDISYF